MKGFFVVFFAVITLCWTPSLRAQDDPASLPSRGLADNKGSEGGTVPVKAKSSKGGGQDFLSGAVMKNVALYLSQAKQLDLTKDQIGKIEGIATELAKNALLAKAQMEANKMDLLNSLQLNDPDQAKINSLIDKDFDIKKQLAKEAVQAFFDLTNLLTPEQKQKAVMIGLQDLKGHIHGRRAAAPVS